MGIDDREKPGQHSLMEITPEDARKAGLVLAGVAVSRGDIDEFREVIEAFAIKEMIEGTFQ